MNIKKYFELILIITFRELIEKLHHINFKTSQKGLLG